ncbi:hypothetical protein FGO68_gene1878 [Halteria grandinella]|uniref:Protein kinase domain-containing protein n=1 Tax=Halteria grandinella TaxID=5974 RepID=A0A8J8NNP8_HALGN|nr:hypothetical protein FGO68_gene1878 [Halteria grandinella]
MDYCASPNLLSVVTKLQYKIQEDKSKIFYGKKQQSNVGFSEDLAQFLFKQLLEGLDFLHFKGYAHLDLKPDNIFLDDNCNVKLAEYQFSQKVLKHGYVEGRSCTMEYAPPEVLNYEGAYNAFQRDIYSMGAAFLSLITGRIPTVIDGKPQWIGEDEKLTKELKDMITKMVSTNPSDRTSVSELLEHPWFNLTTLPCSTKIQIGPLEFNEFVLYLRSIEEIQLVQSTCVDEINGLEELDLIEGSVF